MQHLCLEKTGTDFIPELAVTTEHCSVIVFSECAVQLVYSTVRCFDCHLRGFEWQLLCTLVKDTPEGAHDGVIE